MFDTYLSCHLWDLAAEGIETVLDRLRGEAGAAGVSVTVASPRVALFRPHAGATPRTFRSEGGLQFQPDKAGYSDTRIRPVVAEWLRKVNPLAAVADTCSRLGLTLRGRVACCHQHAVAARFDSTAVKDVFGDLRPDWICPSNPDVREYLRAVIADLSASYAFDTLELEAASFPPDRAATVREWGMTQAYPSSFPPLMRGGFGGVESGLGPAGDWLLSLCFCESCRQSAAAEGADAAAAARSATVILEKSLAAGDPIAKSVADLLASDPVLREYAAWRFRQVTRLIETLKSACRCRLVVLRDGGDFAALAARCDGLLVPLPAPLGDAVEPAIQAAIAETGDAAKVEAAASACASACPDSAALVRALSTAARMGARAAIIDTYGQLPLARLAWIKQAARYAARESQP